MLNLYETFCSLPVPKTTNERDRCFSATAPWGAVQLRVAKNQQGRPYFLTPSTRGARQISIRLEHLSIEPHVECVIVDSDKVVERDSFTLVGCTSDDPGLQSFFLRVIAAFAREYETASTAQDLNRGLELLVALFRALKQPGKKTVRGLWAELFVILESSSPLALLEAWHVDPLDLFDFNQGSDRIEVKSASDRREHHFRREQLIPPKDSRITVASLIVKSAGGGASIADLVTRINSIPGISGVMLEKLSRVVCETLGLDWRSAIDLRFDENQARQSLQFFDGAEIPSIREPPPPQISEVRFIVDFSSLLPIDPPSLAVPGLRGCLLYRARRPT